MNSTSASHEILSREDPRLVSPALSCGYPALMDAELARRISTGDTAAENELCRRFVPKLCASLARRTANFADAQDIAHDTMLVILKKLREETLQDPDRLSNYIHRTARFLLSGEQRRAFNAWRCSDIDVEEMTTLNSPSQSEEVAKTEYKQAIWQKISRLNRERDRQILIQRYLLERTKQEVCDNLQLTPDRFDRVLYNARQRLAAAVGAENSVFMR
ncbi:MAG: sigma-70 family RNA polymerase sigma factor [Pseudomonadota bacterium]